MYHYLIGLRVNERKSLEEGELIYHVDSVFSYTEEDVENVRLTIEAVKNEMWPTTDEEAAKTFGVSGLLTGLGGLLMRARQNNLTVCHFYSNIDLDHEWFDIFFRTNNKEYLSKKIKEAKVKI
jgi:hypothetical protein